MLTNFKSMIAYVVLKPTRNASQQYIQTRLCFNSFCAFDVSLFGVSAPGSRLSLRNNIDPSSSVTDLER